jgi:esterase/lipase superfamily enzyme
VSGAPRRVEYGDAGAPLLYVPSSGGDERELERYGMRDDLAPWIEAGRIRVWSVDGSARRHLWNGSLTPRERMRGYARYERALVREVLPALADAAGESPWVVGTSYGAYVAANLLFKHPAQLAGACGLGGVYGMWHLLEGHHDDDVYFHTPLEFVPRLDDPAILDAIRRTAGLQIFAGERDEWLESSLRMAQVLRLKQLPHRLDVWGGEVGHHERWWRRQLRVSIEARYGPP